MQHSDSFSANLHDAGSQELTASLLIVQQLRIKVEKGQKMNENEVKIQS